MVQGTDEPALTASCAVMVAIMRSTKAWKVPPAITEAGACARAIELPASVVTSKPTLTMFCGRFGVTVSRNH